MPKAQTNADLMICVLQLREIMSSLNSLHIAVGDDCAELSRITIAASFVEQAVQTLSRPVANQGKSR